MTGVQTCALPILLRVVGILVQPFMPGSMAKLLDQLAVPAEARDFAALDKPLPPGTALPAPVGVFPRFVEEGEEKPAGGPPKKGAKAGGKG